MISFVTLFLGLIFGIRPVEVTVGAGVKSVDIFLDGSQVAGLTAPPWTTPVDFGALEPHHLVAVARDPSGAEVGRVSQRINLPRAQAEASLALLPGAGGRDRAARLAWESPVRRTPNTVRVALDGVPMSFDDPSNIPLPPFAPAETHVLRAEVSFPGDILATVELVFTATRSEVASAELTAVPVIVKGGALREAEMSDWFTAGGRPARVAAIDAGSGDIVVVRDEAAAPPLRKIRLPALFDRVLGTGQRIWLCWPGTPKAADAAPGYDVFPLSNELSSMHQLHPILGSAAWRVPLEHPRLADAVAVAGLWAAARNNPRIVLLIHAGSDDASQLRPEDVRRYLRSMNVPFFVWAPDRRSAKRAAAWGDVEIIRDAPSFLSASGRFLSTLSSEKIVWLEGTHLPQSISLSPKASTVSIAR
jgi:hypothetical protein